MPALNAAFYDAVRPLFGGSLKQSQVDGCEAIHAGWQKYGDGSVQREAYVFATAFHESAKTMQAIAEYGKGRGKKYGKKDTTGKAPYGRGLVQLTWRENYVRADKELGLGGKLAANYDLALDPDISVRILITGCLKGWFTSKDLDDYIDGIDESDAEDAREFREARRVVNGTDRAALIGDHALVFEKALKLAVAHPQAPPAPKGWLAVLFELIINFIKGLRK
jgi:hypothetical protein